MHAPIAQLDRVTDYESVGRGFESLSAYQNPDTHSGIWIFVFIGKGIRKIKCNAPGERCSLGSYPATPIFSFAKANENANESLSAYYPRISTIDTMVGYSFFVEICRGT